MASPLERSRAPAAATRAVTRPWCSPHRAAAIGTGFEPSPRTLRTRYSAEPMTDKPDRNLALELVRVTEAAALASARLVGRGDKEAADQAAVDAMRNVLDSVSMDG